jgi:hypothetical protein
MVVREAQACQPGREIVRWTIVGSGG